MVVRRLRVLPVILDQLPVAQCKERRMWNCSGPSVLDISGPPWCLGTCRAALCAEMTSHMTSRADYVLRIEPRLVACRHVLLTAIPSPDLSSLPFMLVFLQQKSWNQDQSNRSGICLSTDSSLIPSTLYDPPSQPAEFLSLEPGVILSIAACWPQI